MMARETVGGFPDNAIAVVGIGLRFAGASTPEQFWQNLRNGVRSIRDYSTDELVAAGVDRELVAGPNYVRCGAPLSDFDSFDAGFFGFSPKEAAIMDPQHRKFLECCWEALEDSTHPPRTFDGPIGVFGGCGMNSYFIFNLLRNPAVRDSVGMFLLRHTGNDKDFLTTRASYCFDLRGPSVSIQTACSTSLVAIHSAAQSLLAGECDMALAGGTTIELPHGRGYEYQPGEILSPDGHCRAFDHQSAGTVFGSGAGVVVLRRLEDAIADGDRIYSVIRGSAINNDGSSKAGYLAPSIDQQAAVASEAMAIADVDADSIGFVAAHGTGTPIGDPIEIAALTQAFRETTGKTQTTVLGSVKPNIGHTDTAAGVASFIAATLALHHGEIPPSVDFELPNPAIDFANSPFVISTELRSWPQNATRPRAMVHSLGVGGTNANVILEASPQVQRLSSPDRPNQIFAISAKSRESLDDQCTRLADHLSVHRDQPLPDVAYTLQIGREPMEHRRVFVARDHDQAIEYLRSPSPPRVFTQTVEPKLSSSVFLFPGGGCQYLQMGQGLYETESVFREVIDRGCDLLRPLIDCDLRELIFCDPSDAPESTRQLERPSIQLPAIFLWEIATAKLWMANGVHPAAMLGHSMGENTAAHLAGVMSFDDALALVVLRGQLLERVPSGSMMTVDMSAQHAAKHLLDEVDIAVVNGPAMCVVSGTDAAMTDFAERMQSISVETKRIPIRIAAHSRLLDSVLPAFRAFLQSIQLRPPAIPFLSNRTGTWITDSEATSPDYWCEQLRHTVRFSDCVETLSKDPSRAFLEVGPGKILSAIIKQHPSIEPKRVVLSSLRHPEQLIPDSDYFLTTQSQLWASGLPIDLIDRWSNQSRQRLSLPTYAFRRDRYWIDPTEGIGETTTTLKLAPMAKRSRIEQWFSRFEWQEVSTDTRVNETNAPSNWLVFMDDAGIGQAIIDELRSRNESVTTVRAGDMFHRDGESSYRIVPELGSDEYERLTQSLADADRLPDQVLYLPPVTIDRSYRPGSTFLMRSLEQGVFGLTSFIKSLTQHIGDDQCCITLVTNGGQSVLGEPIVYPEKSAGLGPILAAPREYPNLKTMTMDIDLVDDPMQTARTLIDQSSTAFHSQCVKVSNFAIRSGKLFERLLVDIISPKTGTFEIRHGGSYLITGGLGGIGYCIAEMLAAEYQAKLVLVSRTELPNRSTWTDGTYHDGNTATRIAQVQRLESLGGEVLVVVADVANQLQMKSAIAAAKARFGKFAGVVHAAGEIDDQLIATTLPESMERVLFAKLHGTRILRDLLVDEELDFFAMCSSSSTHLGPAGQTAYIAANCFLNAFANSDPFPGCATRVLAINWGVWRDIGMAAGINRRIHGETDNLCSPYPCYRVTLNTATDWQLNEHRTPNGTAVLPGTAYVEMAVRAAREAFGDSSVMISDLAFVEPCTVDEGNDIELRVQWVAANEGCGFEIQSRLTADERWTTHAIGTTAKASPRNSKPRFAVAENFASTSDLKTTHQAELLQFGPRWNCYRWIRYDADFAHACLQLPTEFHADLVEHELHPALLDMATGFGLPLIAGYDEHAGLYVPATYGAVRFHGSLPTTVRSTIRLSPESKRDSTQRVAFDIEITDVDGRLIVEIERLEMQLVDANRFGAPARRQRPANKTLTPAEKLFADSYQLGIEPDEGVTAFKWALQQPSGDIFVSSIELNDLAHRFESLNESKGDEGLKFARPSSSSVLRAPVTRTEKWLADVWQELLGIEQISVDDSFLDLGGHSLLAVRFFAKLRQQRDIELPLSTLFEAPTIERIAKLIDQSVESSEQSTVRSTPSSTIVRHRFLVPLHVSKTTDKSPFFIVGGMFGNVLNLRHLATRLGHDQTVYGIQAKGLIGDESPHNRFSAMAVDYLNEIRQVQPIGPYYLGGFSGGGVSAYEMAYQLTQAGEQVAILVMLDTPAVHHQELTLLDKAKIQWDRIRQHGLSYFSTRRNDRRKWIEEAKLEKEQALKQAGAEFRSSLIRDGFMEAHTNYATPRYEGDVHLFRPELEVAHYLPLGRRINRDRQLMDELNHWQQFVGGTIELFEVAGDHDSMVLEPHVRTMARQLTLCLHRAQAKYDPSFDSRVDESASRNIRQRELV